MEFESIVQFLENKCILVTGATGFLAKVFVEKVLRVQPNLKKLYLLVRAADAKSATQRFKGDVIEKEVFKVLRELHPNFDSFVSEKITLIRGDIMFEDLGLKSFNLLKEMWNELDIVINLAANTKFDERYDYSLGTNTFGAMNVLNFAKKCIQLKVFVHVSTAFVCGERSGIIHESPYHMGETLNGAPGLDVDAEKKVVVEKLNELQAQGATQEAITRAMKDLGLERAKTYGWPNTYVFTKAMAEMMIEHMKENMSVVILRPTIVTSTYKELFSGWIEGLKTLDSLAVAYGKGRLPCFPGDSKAIIDVIPADMVVNTLMMAMVAHAYIPYTAIYQIGSSAQNPVRFASIHDYIISYFNKKPWINKDGNSVKVSKIKVLSDMDSFNRHVRIRYLLLLKGLKLVNSMFCKYCQSTYNDIDIRINTMMRLAELYRPYLFFNEIFDDMNTEKLRMIAKESGEQRDAFLFDPKCIDWEDYFMNTHLPGIMQYISK